ncbi:MAG: 30S ribosomal protein S17 [Kofleriaceae bacterium]|nr:30S ribosomal protein S17 [Kofleriaceae bacterium]MCL4223490.1 30S ribosomal protein S17 [Myxococcales bacterium]
MSAEQKNEHDGRGSRRKITGTVTSNAMDKTIVVSVVRRVRDRRFHKFVTRRVKYKAHDELNASAVGDVVEIIESRPYSRTKKWRVFRTITKADQTLVKEVLP